MVQEQKKNWWGRNWKWCVPLGCLGTIAVILAFVLGILSLVFGMIKSSEPYKQAVAQVSANADVQQAIGTPIETGLLVSGNINTSGSSGNADLAIPISGPDGKARIFAVASKSAGQWTFSTLAVEIEASEARIELIDRE